MYSEPTMIFASSSQTPSEPVWLPLLIIPVFFIVFPLFWCFVVKMISVVGGWGRLAKRFAAGDKAVTGKSFQMVTGMVGLSSYRNMLTIHFAEDGFFLDVMPIFRVGHPRLFIPWTAISNHKSVNRVLWKATKLWIGSPSVGTVHLPSALFAEFGQSLQEENK